MDTAEETEHIFFSSFPKVKFQCSAIRKGSWTRAYRVNCVGAFNCNSGAPYPVYRMLQLVRERRNDFPVRPRNCRIQNDMYVFFVRGEHVLL